MSDVVIPVKQYPYATADFGFGALTNSLSTSELLNFVSTDFFDDADKEKLLSSIPSSLRYGYSRVFEFAYYEPGYPIYDVYKQGWGIGLRNTYYNSARLSKDMLNLIFYGNKPYAGETVNAGHSGMDSWYYSSIDYLFDVMLDSLLPLHLTTSIHVGHDHSGYNIEIAEIYTDPIGEYLDTDLEYSTRNTPLNSSVIAGMGVSMGAEIDFKIRDKGNLNIQVNDLGVMYWNQGEVLMVDSTFRFEGVYFDNIFDLNDSIREYASDSYQNAFFYSDSKSYARLMPFRISAGYSHKTEKYPWLKEVFIAANYRYLPGYYPQLKAGAEIKTGYKQRLTTTLTAGGYTWAGLDIGYYFEIGYDWKVALAIHNINGLIIPVMSGGAYGTLSLNYRL